MKFTTLLVSTLAGLAMADDSDKKQHKNPMAKKQLTGDQQQCHRIAKLNHIMHVANNQTKLDRIASQQPERAQKIKNDALRAEPELSTMQKNSTLMRYCGQYNAHERLVKQCGNIKHGERLTSKLKNNTAIEETARRKNKSADEVKSHWQKEINHINRLKSNSTLNDQCKKMKSTKDSKDGKKDGKKADAKNDKGKAEKQKSAAARVQVVGTGAFALGLSVLLASLML